MRHGGSRHGGRTHALQGTSGTRRKPGQAVCLRCRDCSWRVSRVPFGLTSEQSVDLVLTEHAGLVLRKSYATVPPHVEYSLTPLGREVGLRVEALADWIEFNLPNIMDARRRQASEAGAYVAASSTVRRIRR